MSHNLEKERFETFTNYSFDYIETPIIGVGKQHEPFVNMEQYVDLTNADRIHKEIVFGLSKIDEYGWPEVVGAMPPGFQGSFEAEIYRSLKDREDQDYHRDILNSLTDEKQRRKYAIFALGALPPWWFSVMIRHSGFMEKAKMGREKWTKDAHHFPLLCDFIESCSAFTEIGRVLLFCTYPGVPVPPHRDFIVKTHSDHNINVFFDGGRRSYVYDCQTNQKSYIDPEWRAYFFNNRDYHGVDADEKFRYTLRIDGTFTQKVCQDLNLYGDDVCRIA